MITYKYKCEKGHEFEARQSIKDEPLKECRVIAPDMRLYVGEYGESLLPTKVYCCAKCERVISADVRFLFKGTGFYATDYKRNKR